MKTIFTSQYCFFFAKNSSYNLFSNIIWTIIYNEHLQANIGFHSNQHLANPVPMSGALGTSEVLGDPVGLGVFSPQLSPSLSQWVPSSWHWVKSWEFDSLGYKGAWPLRNNCAFKMIYSPPVRTSTEQQGQNKLALGRQQITRMCLQGSYHCVFER